MMELFQVENLKSMQFFVDNLPLGFALHRMFYDGDRNPCDYEFIMINKAFEMLTGLKRDHIVGKRVCSVMPEIKKDPADWIKRYGELAKGKAPIQFEQYSAALGYWYDVFAFSPSENYFITFFDHLKDQKFFHQTSDKQKSFIEGVLDAFPTPLFIVDDQRRIILWNQQAQEVTHIPENQVLGKECSLICKNARIDDCPITKTQARELLGRPCELMISEDSFIDCVKNITAIYDQGNNVVGALEVFYPANQLPDAEKLCQSEKKFRLMAELSHDAIFMIDQRGKVEFWNQAASKIFGFTEDEILFKSVLDYLVVDSHQQEAKSFFQRKLSENISEMKGETFVTLAKCKDQRSFSGEVSLSPFQLDGERKFLVSIRDLSERERSRHLLATQKGQLQDAQQIAKIGSYSVQLKTAEMQWSPELCRIVQLMPQEPQSLEVLRSRVHPDDQMEVDNHIEQWAEEIVVFNLEYRMLMPDGKVKWVHERAHQLANDEGYGKQILGTVMDISDRKRMELEKDEIQAKLYQVAKLADLGTLAAGVAHEINNPLAIISGYAERMERMIALNKDFTISSLEESLGNIQKGVERIKDIVQGLRNYSRSDHITFEEFYIHQVIEETLGLMKSIILKSNISIEIKLDAAMDVVLGNRGKFQQVLMNLLVNARDALEGVENACILISTKSKEGFIVLEIMDNGLGIKEEDQPKIFNPFFTTKMTGKGTGLGLSIVQGIVSDLGGAISVSSLPSSCTTFTVTLPTVFRVLEDTSLDISVDNPEEEVSEKLSGKVLLVEDELELRAITKYIIEGFGLEVVEAADGEEALKLISSSSMHFDVLITDLKMPVMSGEKLIRQLTDFKYFDGGKIIVLTGGLVDQDHQKTWLDDICHCVLKKPISKTMLYNVIRQCLLASAR